jgi:hypothetical protein
MSDIENATPPERCPNCKIGLDSENGIQICDVCSEGSLGCDLCASICADCHFSACLECVRKDPTRRLMRDPDQNYEIWYCIDHYATKDHIAWYLDK